MRDLTHGTADLTDAELERLYAVPRTPWLRVNMVSTVDGAATGGDGTSGTINNAADKRVFDLLRRQADAVLVGAGTARTEGYRPTDRPLVLVTRSGSVPEGLLDAEPGRVLVATTHHAEGLATLRERLGGDHVILAVSHRVDLAAVRPALGERGLGSVLCEGGPHLLRDLLDQGVVDELCTTTVPRVVGGQHARITDGAPVDVPLSLGLLLEEGGTLLARWYVPR